VGWRSRWTTGTSPFGSVVTPRSCRVRWRGMAGGPDTAPRPLRVSASPVTWRNAPPRSNAVRSLATGKGDLVIGKGGKTTVATLVERTSRFLVLVPLTGRDSLRVSEAIISAVGSLPATIKRSLTWDCGAETALHKDITATGLPVYFAHPHSPWERGSNENLNRIVREYFPQGVKITSDPHYLAAVTAEINDRPRKIHDWKKPSEVFTELLEVDASIARRLAPDPPPCNSEDLTSDFHPFGRFPLTQPLVHRTMHTARGTGPHREVNAMWNGTTHGRVTAQAILATAPVIHEPHENGESEDIRRLHLLARPVSCAVRKLVITGQATYPYSLITPPRTRVRSNRAAGGAVVGVGCSCARGGSCLRAWCGRWRL
jgi:hypothetical protein